MSVKIQEDNGFYSKQLNDSFYKLYQVALTNLAKGRFLAKQEMEYDEAVFNAQSKILVQAIVYEHPELFYINQFATVSYNNGKAIVVFKSLYDELELNRLSDLLEEKIDCIYNSLKEYADDKMTLLYKLNEYLCTAYEGENRYTDDNGNALGVVINKRARCEGFCKVAKLVLRRFDIGSIICTGNVTLNDQTIPHAWLAVYFEGEYYAFDYSFNASTSYLPVISPVYTFMDKETINIDRTEDYAYPITNNQTYLFWILHHGETYYISDLGNADPIKTNNGFITVHHLINFQEITAYEDAYEISKWIEANVDLSRASAGFSHVLIRNLSVLLIYYFND